MTETLTRSLDIREHPTPVQEAPQATQVDQLEKRLGDNARMDANILAERLATEVSFPNGVAGTVDHILSDDELLISAIAAAGDAYDRYYDVIAKVPSDHREKMRNGREAELEAHRGILARARAGKYNGRSVIISEFAQYFIGSYIAGGHDVAEKFVEPQIQRGETIIFRG
jgi:hypothetical protein